jgi:hypothetical protein
MEREREARPGTPTARTQTPVSSDIPDEPLDRGERLDRDDRDEEHKIFGLGISAAESRQPAYGQGVVISLLVAGALLVLAIIAIGDGDGSDPPLLQTTDWLFWLIAAVVVVVAAAGAQFAERTAATAAAAVGHPRPPTAMATAWTVPSVATFGAIILVATYHNRAMLFVGPLIAFFGIAGALLSRDLLDEADAQSSRVAATIHTLVVHAVAFLALSAVYLNKLDTWIFAPLVGIIGGILVLETLERGGAMPPRRIVYAIIGGFLIGQCAVPLNWWLTYGWTGGAVLLVVFYVIAGLMLSYAQRATLRPRDLVEFGALGFALLVFLAITS